MKIKIIALIICLLILAGCQNTNILKCINEEEANGLKLNEEVILTYKSKNPYSVIVNLDINALNDDSKKIWNELVDFYTKRFPISNEEGIDVLKNNNDKEYSYTLRLDIDLSKVSEESLEKYELEDLLKDRDSIDDVKLEAEKSGFTCHITAS